MGRISRIPNEILRLLSSASKQCWTIEEIQIALAKQNISADFSSIFRAVSKLYQENRLSKAELDDGKTHYELIERHHDHLYCRVCKTVTLTPCNNSALLVDAVAGQRGFEPISHSLIIEGVCKECNKRGERYV